jgi:DNA-3-methyladenine glycosylase
MIFRLFIHNRIMTTALDFLSGDTVLAAKRLLGCHLVRTLETGERIVARIVETEAYTQTDAASHSFKGKTPRTDVMFGPAGHAYVYFTYGMHYCFNVTTGAEGEGAAVLIRAVEIIEGEEYAKANRPVEGVNLTNGPAKLCQALAITKAFNGYNLSQVPLELRSMPEIDYTQVVQTTRIGIRNAVDNPWRFYLKDSPWVSKK